MRLSPAVADRGRRASASHEAALMRFMRGETSVRLDRADVLAEYFELELVKRKAQ
jgi:hypothetical protein